MGLFKPAWMGGNEGKARKALGKIHDDNTLIEVATKCPHPSVQIEAVRKITGEEGLFCVIRDWHVPVEAKMDALDRASDLVLADAVRSRFTPGDIKLEAVARIADPALLADIVTGANSFDKANREEREAAYERLEHPSFECSMAIHTKRADENILADLDGMSYPEDRDNIVRVARERSGDPAEWAVSMLPYEGARDVLRELAVGGAGTVRSAALAKLRLPDDRDIVDAIFADPKSGKVLVQRAARLLPDLDLALDERCCPHCGAVGTVVHQGGYDEWLDMYYQSYKCIACKHEVYEHSVTGDVPAKDFSITLRELRDR